MATKMRNGGYKAGVEVGTYPTRRGAIREARKFARAHSTQTGYRGYGPTITLVEIDSAGNAVSAPETVRAW